MLQPYIVCLINALAGSQCLKFSPADTNQTCVVDLIDVNLFMIATLTLNPSIDKHLRFERLVPEKKMRCSAIDTDAGGGGINVSKAIRELGGQSIAVYPAGGIAGKQLLQLLQEKCIESCNIPVTNDTRENFNADELSTGRQYRFVTPGPSITGEELAQVTDAIKALKDISFLVCSGSLPPGVPSEFLTEISDIAKDKDIRFLLDTSGDPLLAAMKHGAFLVKPNITELKSLTGKDHIEENEVAGMAVELMHTVARIEVMVVSMGAGGAMLVTKDGCKRFRAPMVKKLSTVGAGDSMVAGITWKLEHGSSLEDAVRFGVACGTAATVQTGTQLFRKADAEKYFDQVTAD